MDLHLHEAIALLSLDDEKGNFTHAGGYIHYAFVAALIMDLMLLERIRLDEDKVQLRTNAITDSRALNQVIERIQERKKARRVQDWMHDLVQRVTKLRTACAEKLIQDGILKKEEGKILWVFSVDRYPTKDAQPENELRQRLKALMLDASTTPDTKERMLLAIVLKCNLYSAMISDKKDRKEAKARLEALTSSSEMQAALGKAIDEMHASIMVATSVVVTS